MGSPTAPPLFLRLAAHPLRWRLLTELAASDRRVGELVELLDQPQNLVSYHLRLLRDGELVTARRSSLDGRDTYYHLDLDRCAAALAHTGEALHPALSVPHGLVTEPIATDAVLFVCSGNSARSPIAEALLRHRTGGRVVVASAGTLPKEQVHPHAVRVLRERFAIDISDRSPRAIAEVAGTTRFDRVVSLCDKARAQLPTDLGGRRGHWSLPDPAANEAGYSEFESVAEEIDVRVRHLVPTLQPPQDNDQEVMS
jgi:protein-tyrosine-phosphatase